MVVVPEMCKKSDTTLCTQDFFHNLSKRSFCLFFYFFYFYVIFQLYFFDNLIIIIINDKKIIKKTKRDLHEQMEC
jgi:hypothetical protein